MLDKLKLPALLGVVAVLSGCNYDILSPAGWVGEQQRNLLVISTLLMLIVIIPVLVMAVWFPLRYRADRKDLSDYAPDWAHSNKIEYMVWGGPIVIIIALGAFTWVYTHRLDPYRPLDIAAEPVEVEAVSLDWKWLFIYPEQGIATINELAIPEGRPINLRLTSSTVMNTFSVPALGGMIYSMAGMETKLHLVANEIGTFAGRSAHYSGPGFSGMTFDTISMSEDDFEGWVTKVKLSSDDLTRANYLKVETPSFNEPVRYFGKVDDGLFDRIRGLCVEEGKVCMDHMMMIDEQGGGGLEGIADEHKYEYDQDRAIDGFGRPLPRPEASLTTHDNDHASAAPLRLAQDEDIANGN